MRLLRRIDLDGFALEPRERALIRVELADGALLATDVSLHVLHESDERIEWWKINHVWFDPEEKNLRITTEDGPIEFEMRAPSLLPEAVRERVMATILTSTTYVTPTKTSAVISIRRRPVDGGEDFFVQIDWQGSPTPTARDEAERRGRLLMESLVFSSPLRLR